MQFNLIGTGRLGRQLSAAFIGRASLQLAGVYNRSPQRATTLVDALGQGRVVEQLADLPFADLTVIAVSDDAIEQVALDLSALSVIRKNDMVFHCSGAKTSDVLSSLRARGALIGSCHPPIPFSDGPLNPDVLDGLYCMVEGDAFWQAAIAPILLQCGAKAIPLSSAQKPQYHAAAVFASNYPLLLLHHAEQAYIGAGITPMVAKEMTLKMVRAMLANYEGAGSLKEALTGPIKREDGSTIALHLEALEGQMKKDYQSLGHSLATCIGSSSEILQLLADDSL